MGAVADLPLPQGGAIAELPIPTTSPVVTPEQADVSNFTATSGAAAKGFRSGMNSIGATMHQIVGSTGEALGLTQFAQDRYKDAQNFVDFADKVGPDVRDIGQVKDFNTLSQFVLGMGAQGAATSLPAIGLAVGLRRPVAGISIPTFLQEAGEQSLNLHQDPNVMASTTPKQRLANEATKGVINTGLELVGGAPAQAARRILNPVKAIGGAAKTVLKSTAGEGLTEGAQNVVGQKLHQELNPEKQLDTHDILNDIAAGAAGGGVIGGGAHAVGAAPSVIAKTADELRTRLSKKEAPVDPNAIPDEAIQATTQEDVIAALRKAEEKIKAQYANVTDPAKRQELFDSAMQRYRESEIKPVIDEAVKKTKPILDGIKQYAAEKGIKFSEQRTQADDDILDHVTENMPPEFKDAATPEQLQGFGDMIRKIAENPQEFKDTSVLHTLQKVLGPRFKGMTDFAVERINDSEQGKIAAKRQIAEAFGKKDEEDDFRLNKAKDIVRTYAKPAYGVDKQMRETMMNTLVPQLLDHLHTGFTAKDLQSDKAKDSHFVKALYEAFGENSRKVMEELDELRLQKPTTTARAFEGGRAHEATDEGGRGFDPKNLEATDEGGREDVAQGTTQASIMADSPLADSRLDRIYKSAEAAEKGAEALRKEYGPKQVKFSVNSPAAGEPGYGTHTVIAQDADQEGLSPEELLRVREPGTIGASGLDKGIIIARTDEHKTGVKVNLMRLTSLMMMREGQQTQEGGAKFVADMFSRGMSAMVSTPGFRMFVATGKGAPLTKDSQGRWSLPDSTPVGRLAGKTYTYGDIKVHRLTRMELKGITKEDTAMEEAFLRDTPAGREYNDELAKLRASPAAAKMSQKEIEDVARERVGLPVTDEQFRDEAIKRAVERSQQFAENQTYAETHEQGQDSGIVEPKPSSPSRDVNERRQYSEDPKSPDRRITEEHTRSPVGGILPAAAEQLPKGRPGGEEVDINAQTPATRANQMASEDQVKNRLKEDQYRRENAEKFSLMENQKPQSLEDFVKDLNEKHPQMEVRMEHYGESLYLELIMARKESDEGKGYGPKVMRDIVKYADSVDKGIFLRAYPKDKDKMPLVKLEKFYEKFGFEPFDMKDREYPGDMTEMYRNKQGAPDGTKETVQGPDEEGEGRAPSQNVREDTNQIRAKGQEAEVGMMALAERAGAVRFATMNVGKGPVDEATQQAVRDYVKKVLGDNKTEVLFEKMAQAGSFAKLGDVETMKIAIDAIDPMSVGYHEALHAFFARLTKADQKAAHTLLRAAGAAPIVARLRQLLADHPKALEQLSDPEERLAYMYQFSAKGEKGLITLGPETKTWFEKAKKFFKLIGAIWSDEMTTAMAVERSNEILEAFHNGEFANRSTVAQVLHDRFPPDAREQTDRVFPQLGRFMNKFVWTATGAVRDMNIPPLTDVMNKFHTDTEGGEAGFLQTKHTVFNGYMNRVSNVLKGATEARKKEIWDELHTTNRTSPEAIKIASILSDAHDYMTKAGVKLPVWNEETKKYDYKAIPKLENYFPRVPDIDYLKTKEGEAGFKALLAKHGIQDVQHTYDAYTSDSVAGNPREDEVLGLTYYTPQTQGRKLGMITDEELAPYLNKDLVGTMSQYLARTARRGEYTKRFGNAGEEIKAAIEKAKALGLTDAQEKTFEESVKAMEGTLGGNMSKELKAVYGALTTYQNIRLLPLALFSSFVDPLGIVVRGGTLAEGTKAFWRGISDLAKLKQDDAYQLAQTIGAINIANDAQVVGDMYSSQFMPSLQKRINDKFFHYIGMESFNKSMRVAASAAAEQFLIRHATKPNAHSERYLTELGLTKDDLTINDGHIELNDKVTRALNLWVDQAILRPNAALRPQYMSDPNWILISHLKQYTYMFQKIIVARVHHELSHGNYTPAYALAGYVPVIIASDMLRAGLTPGSGDDHPERTALDWFWRGLQRAGLFGPGQFALDSANDFQMNHFGVESLIGPVGQQLLDFLRAGATGQGLGRQVGNAVPFGRQMGLGQ